jgi:hypothetical protein
MQLERRLSYGKEYDRILDAGVQVSEGEGLLVVKSRPAAQGTQVRVSDRELGEPPLEVSLPAGRHELAFERGAETSYRYLYLRHGRTRVVEVP